jgi:hypothetical protein
VSPLKANVYIKDEMMTLKCYILHEKGERLGGWVGGWGDPAPVVPVRFHCLSLHGLCIS